MLESNASRSWHPTLISLSRALGIFSGDATFSAARKSRAAKPGVSTCISVSWLSHPLRGIRGAVVLDHGVLFCRPYALTPTQQYKPLQASSPNQRRACSKPVGQGISPSLRPTSILRTGHVDYWSSTRRHRRRRFRSPTCPPHRIAHSTSTGWTTRPQVHVCPDCSCCELDTRRRRRNRNTPQPPSSNSSALLVTSQSSARRPKL